MIDNAHRISYAEALLLCSQSRCQFQTITIIGNTRSKQPHRSLDLHNFLTHNQCLIAEDLNEHAHYARYNLVIMYKTLRYMAAIYNELLDGETQFDIPVTILNDTNFNTQSTTSLQIHHQIITLCH